MRYAVTDLSGTIVRHGTCGAVEHVEIQAGPDELAHVVPDEVSDPDAYEVHDGEWSLKPAILPTLDDLKEAAFRRVRMLRDLYAAGGCDTAFGRVDTQSTSMANISIHAFMAAQQSEAYSVDWRMQDNSIVTLNAEQMTKLALAVGRHASFVQDRKNVLDRQITAAKSLADIEAIAYEDSWYLTA